jgi:4-hydroxythreonine-4-phosphate dehydrogenase
VEGDVEFLDLRLLTEVDPGTVSGRNGDAAYRYILEALKLVSTGDAAAVVTAPISKAALHMAGVPFVGHTEILADFGGVDRCVMMMANPGMKVALVTIHEPLKAVPALITPERVFECIRITGEALSTRFGIARPRLKVCGLNPHAGEEGLMGDEEQAIRTAIAMARPLAMEVEGPFPADTLFHHVDCDAFVAMYHDQGLIPVKTIDFSRTVNITLGLPFIRTSPGHGTGFDIAGRGIADPSGLLEAYRVAERMSGIR